MGQIRIIKKEVKKLSDEEYYTLIEKEESFYFQGAKINGTDISQIPYKKCGKILNLFLRHCKKSMRLFVPTTLPSSTVSKDDISIVRCDKCGVIQPRYLLDGFA